jgi:nitrile hydratase beta subunit
VNGPQDIGGRQGLGPVLAEPDELVFHADWERRVFGLSFCGWVASGVSVDESREAQARMPYARYYGSSYFERWLYSLERLMVRKGVLSEEELETGAVAADEIPPPLVEPDRLAKAVVGLALNGAERLRHAPAPPAYGVGDKVRAKVVNPRSYDRLPAYVKGRAGVIEEHYGAFARPEDLAAGRYREPGAHCYRVRFEASELWGESAERPGDAVCIDLFESYLEPG